MACTPPPEAIAVLDLEADAGLGLANNDPVALWADQSTAGNNATQGTGANKPTFKSADGPGGLPCVTFDGTTDFLVLPDISSQKYTIFAVLKPANNSLHSIVCGAAGSLQYRTSNSLKQNILRCNELNLGESTTALSTSAFQQINVRWDGTTGLFRLNGAADGLITSPSSMPNPINRIGINGASLGEFFEGSICMIKVYLDALALDQVQAQEALITARWGV
jgi:hypothetical protein